MIDGNAYPRNHQRRYRQEVTRIQPASESSDVIIVITGVSINEFNHRPVIEE